MDAGRGDASALRVPRRAGRDLGENRQSRRATTVAGSGTTSTRGTVARPDFEGGQSAQRAVVLDVTPRTCTSTAARFLELEPPWSCSSTSSGLDREPRAALASRRYKTGVHRPCSPAGFSAPAPLSMASFSVPAAAELTAPCSQSSTQHSRPRVYDKNSRRLTNFPECQLAKGISFELIGVFYGPVVLLFCCDHLLQQGLWR